MNKSVFKLLLSILLIMGGIAHNFAQGSSKSDKQQIESIAKKMFDDVNDKNFDALLDLTHPKLFEIVPKEQMKAVFKSMFEGNDEFSIEIPKEIPDYKLSNIFNDKENNVDYSFLSYDMSMKMTFLNQEFDDEMKEMMVSMMQVKGMEVEFVSNSSLNVLMKDRITIILKDDDTDNKWAMINYDTDSPIFYKVLSASILEKAKEYKQNLMLERKKKDEK